VRGEMRIAKNTLVRHAIKGTKFEALDTNLGGQISLILSYEDPVVLAKTFTSFGPLGEKLQAARRGTRRQSADGAGSGSAVEAAVARSDFQPVARAAQCAGDPVGPPAQRAGFVPGARDRRDWKKERCRGAGCGSRDGFIGTCARSAARAGDSGCSG